MLSLSKHALTKCVFWNLSMKTVMKPAAAFKALERDGKFLHATIGLSLCDGSDIAGIRHAIALSEERIVGGVEVACGRQICNT
jgi:hypothetical protein